MLSLTLIPDGRILKFVFRNVWFASSCGLTRIAIRTSAKADEQSCEKNRSHFMTDFLTAFLVLINSFPANPQLLCYDRYFCATV